MPNIKAAIDNHNKKKTESEGKGQVKPCNCRSKGECPLKGRCREKEIVYQATVATEDGEEAQTYVGLTANEFKTRFRNHKMSFNNKKSENSSELSEHIRELEEKGKEFKILWKILRHAQEYSNKTKRCNLCLREKFYIITRSEKATLNKRTELVSKCRHSRKFLLAHN